MLFNLFHISAYFTFNTLCIPQAELYYLIIIHELLSNLVVAWTQNLYGYVMLRRHWVSYLYRCNNWQHNDDAWYILAWSTMTVWSFQPILFLIDSKLLYRLFKILQFLIHLHQLSLYQLTMYFSCSNDKSQTSISVLFYPAPAHINPLYIKWPEIYSHIPSLQDCLYVCI